MSSPLITFYNGNKFPLIGFGTYCITELQIVIKALDEALKVGYRSFDTAAMYDNEVEIGKALKTLLPKHNLTREDIFVTSKLAPEDQGAGAEEAARRSLRNLDCGYLDLFLIHWPGNDWSDNLRGSDPSHRTSRRQSWASLVKLHKEGLLKNIGVSNYTVKHIRELVNDCDGVKPVLNQIEWHPHNHPEDIYDECQLQGIQVQAYSSLGGSGNKSIINDAEVKAIAEKIGKPIGQVLLQWAVQRNVAVIPKAVSPKHMIDNLNLDFVIPENYMQQLNNVSTKHRYDWNPELVD